MNIRIVPALVAIFILTATVSSGCRRDTGEATSQPGVGTVDQASGTPTPYAAPPADQAEPPEPKTNRVLMVGADGLEWNVLLPLVQQGQVPEIARLMQQGTFGQMTTVMPTVSPRIWTTIATGKGADKHGIRKFRYRDPENPGTHILYNGTDRKTKAFWDILSDYGCRVHVVGWWMTFPVEPINGVMVAQTNTLYAFGEDRTIGRGQLLDGVEKQVYPPERQAEMMEVLSQTSADLPGLLKEIFGEFPYPLSAQAEHLFEITEWSFRGDATYAAIGCKLAAEEKYDVMAVYLGGSDTAGHRFWRYLEPGAYRNPPTAEEVENFGKIIEKYYVYVDRVIGDLRRASGDDVTIMVMADHGMKAVRPDAAFAPDDRGESLISGHHYRKPPAVFIAAGPSIRQTTLAKPLAELTKDDLPIVADVHDITPTLLALMCLPVGIDMDGKVLVDVISPEHLEAYPVHKIPTHDTAVWLASRPKVKLDYHDSDEREKQLIELGYIERPATSKPAKKKRK